MATSSTIEILVKIKDEAQAALKKIQQASNDVSGVLGKSSDGLLKGASKDAKTATDSLKKTTKEANATKASIKSVASANFATLKSSLADAAKNFKTIRAEATATKTASNQLGAAMKAAFAGIGIATTVKSTVDFSRAITEVSTLVDSAITPTDELTKSVLSLSDSYGVNAVETAQGLYQAISSGAEQGAEANTLLEVALKTAKAGVTDTATAVDGITTVINAFGKGMGDAESVSDVLFATMKSGKTTIGELSSFMFQAAPLASALGISFEEVNGAVVAMSLQGTKTAQAMTGLRAALQGMIRPGGEAEEAFQKAGFESAKAAIEVIGLEGALNLMADAADGNQGKLLAMVGSVEGAQAIMQTTGDKAKYLKDGLEAVNGSAGAMQQAFDKVEVSIAQKYDVAITNAINSMIRFGEVLKPTLTALFELVTAGSQALSSFVEEHQKLVTVATTAVTTFIGAWAAFKALKLVASFTGLTTVIKALAPVLLSASPALSSLVSSSSKGSVAVAGLSTSLGLAGKAVKALSGLLLSNPITAVLVGIATAGVLVYDAYSDLEEANKRVAEADSNFRNSLDLTKNFLRDTTIELAKYNESALKSSSEIANLDANGAKAYEATLNKVIQLQEATKALGDRQIESGEEVVAGYSNIESTLEGVSTSMEALKARVAELAEENALAEKSSSRFSDAILDAANGGKDAVAALANEFKSFNALDLDDVRNVVNGIGLSATEAFDVVNKAGASVSESLQESLSGKSLDEINKFIDRLGVLAKDSSVNAEALASANSAAVGAIFKKLGVETTASLAEVDKEIIKLFGSLVDSGQASSQDLVKAVEANVSKLSTLQGVSDFKDLIKEAMTQAGADTGLLGTAIDALNSKQTELTQKANTAGVALTSAASAMGIQTIEQGTTAYNDLKDAYGRVADGFSNGAVSLTEYNQGVLSYLEGTRDYLINVQGVSTELANSTVQAEAAQQGLRVSISETGSIAQVTEASIRTANQETKNLISQNAQELSTLQQDAMAATVGINQEGWATISESVKASYASAVEAEAVARAQMLESRTLFEEASASGDTFLIENAKAQYDTDVDNYKTALEDKITAGTDANAELVAQAEQASESIKQVAVSGSVALGEIFAGIQAGNAEVIQTIQDNTTAALNGIGNTTALGYASAFGRVMEAQAKAIRDATKEYETAEAKLNKYTEALANTDNPSKQLISNAEYAIRTMDALDSQQLSGLQSAIIQAKNQMDQLYQSAVSTLQGLQSELASLRGNVLEVENIQYKQRVEELQVKLEAARVAGDAATINALEDSLRVLGTIHKETLTNIQTEANAKKKADEEELARQKAIVNSSSSSDTAKGFSTGGYVDGVGSNTSDSISARLSRGEYVMDAKTVGHFGSSFMKRLQLTARGFRPPKTPSVRRFAVGGPVSAGGTSTSTADFSGQSKKTELTINIGGNRIMGVYEDTEADRMIQALEEAGATI